MSSALAYLFKLPEGDAAGCDPGFFHQSAELARLLAAIPDDASPVQASSGFVGGVVCAGLSCVDMQLLGAVEPSSKEAIATFSGCSMRGGGSAPNTACALATLGVPSTVLSQVR